MRERSLKKTSFANYDRAVKYEKRSKFKKAFNEFIMGESPAMDLMGTCQI
jgi:hypothetical protein